MGSIVKSRRGRAWAVLALVASLVLIAGESSTAQTPRARAVVESPVPDPVPTAPGATPGEAISIFHLYMGTGDDVYEKFGHNALWVHDPVAGTDRVFNYGMFDFDAPGYWARFIRGDWLYTLGVDDLNHTIYAYQFVRNRSIVAQELNLTPSQRGELRDFLEWNALEENRYYYYDYYYDNCSTRVRDALDRVLGGRLRDATADSLTGTTFRWHSDRLVAGDPGVVTGLRIGLASGADREISAWEEMFLPEKVKDQLRTMQVVGPDGSVAPLVLQERTIFNAVGREPVRDRAPGWFAWYLLVGALIGGALAGLAHLAPRSRAARFGYAAMSALWIALVGVAGLILLFLWLATNHTIAHANENLLQFNPLLVLLLPVLPALAFGARWAARPALVGVAVIAALSVLGLLLKPLPFMDQANLSMIALMLPAHLGLAWSATRLAHRLDLPADRRSAAPAARGEKGGRGRRRTRRTPA
jgi:hypothetical protein